MMVKSSTYTSIVIIEPHGILREGLRALIELEVDLRVVGEAGTGADGVRVVQSTDPALVITDLAPPGTQGLRIIEQLRAASARVHALVLTSSCTTPRASRCSRCVTVLCRHSTAINLPATRRRWLQPPCGPRRKPRPQPGGHPDWWTRRGSC